MRHLVLMLAGAALIMTTSSANRLAWRSSGWQPARHALAAVGRNGMIATSQALASAAGLKVLQDGGNAIDAAITAAAVLAVVEPSMNGIGGDLLGDRVGREDEDALRRSTRAGAPPYRGDAGGVRAARPHADARRRAARRRCARRRRGLAQLLARFGTIPLGKALQPAIRYARDGFPVAGNHGRRMAGRGEEAGARSARRRRSCRTAAPPRTARSSPTRGSPRTPRTDRRRTAATRSTTGRSRAPSSPTCRARNGLLDERDFAEHTADWVETDLDQLSRLRRARDAAEHAGIRRARDAEHPRGLRHQGDGPQQRRLPARRHRSQEDRVCRSRGVSCRPRAMADGRAEDADLEGLRCDAAQGDRHRERAAAIYAGVAAARQRRRRAISRPRSRRHDLHDRRRRPGQCRSR